MPQMNVWPLIGLLMAGFWIGCLGPVRAVETIWEVTAYRVHLLVAVEPGPTWPDDQNERLAYHLATQSQTYIGALWEVRAEAAPPALARKMLADLENLQEEDLPAGWQKEDKLLLVAVRASAGAYQIKAREWDVRTRLFGAVASAMVVQPAKLGQVALHTLIEAFCPLARIDRPKQGQALLRPRGMALPRPPGSPQWIKPGTILRPVLRKSDRQGNPISIKPVDWTYLVVQRLSPQGLECRVYSALAASLAERRRGRIEMLALVVLPRQRPTVLVLADRNEPTKPLVGYEVFSYNPNQPELHALGRTDLRGQVLIPPSADGLRMLLVARGGTPMARFPVVPGLQERLQLLLPKDSPRLAAEAFFRGFQESLLDLVAQREILLARMQLRLQKGQLEQAALLLEELEQLRRDRDALAVQLTQQEKTLTTNDPELRSKIEALWSQARQLLAQHADDRILQELASKLLQAKQTANNTQLTPEPKP
ncbi:MAG: hypothetical protein NZ602_02480 [Thermoguttaceae bacterium]|nr:hypothetical protein [Thermoguttaceae bacterium]MDW8036735.1 hypothetical protein [Thermoguttaceae bacterium]